MTVKFAQNNRCLISGKDDQFPTEIVITLSLLALILLLLILLFALKHLRTKTRSVEQTRVEINQVYGDYVDPDPTVEVEDTNAYYSSDYEAGKSRMTDNNLYYQI